MPKFQKNFITVESHSLIDLTNVYNINRVDSTGQKPYKIRFYFDHGGTKDWKFSDISKRNEIYTFLSLKLGTVFKMSDINESYHKIKSIENL